ncbi:MAG TPA: YihY/virulence factor BrkB family protein [Pseudonocardiaceae bacterium]
MGPRSNDDGRSGTASRQNPVPRGPLRLLSRTISRAWEDNIFSEAAEAAFWTALSLPPLLLGLLGSLGFLADWFGPEIVEAVQTKILAFTRTVFTPNVVEQIIAPTVEDILTKGRGEIVSVGFVLSLWAGSSAMASYVDAITVAYGQYEVRHPVWQRIVALLTYMVYLLVAVIGLPVLALGPDLLPEVFPTAWQPVVADAVDRFYYPVTGVLLVIALSTLYKVALPRKLPWHRGLPGALLAMVVFLLTSTGLRWYITWITSTGYTYGALATPIAFLLFAFFIGFAIVLGAHFNNAIQELWPARMTRRERRRWRRLEMERAAERLRSEQEAQTRRRGATVSRRTTAPSPADLKDTTPLRRDDLSSPDESHIPPNG